MKQLFARFWYLFLPVPVLFFEEAAQRLSTSITGRFVQITLQQPWDMMQLVFLSVIRVWAVYALFSAAIYLLVDCLFRKKNISYRLICGLYLGVCGVIRLIFENEYPALDNHSRISVGLWLLLFGTILCFLPYPSKTVSYRSRRHGCVVVVILSALLFWATPRQPVSHAPSPQLAKNALPSFILLSFDGIPADFFRLDEQGDPVAPKWKSRWQSRSIEFENAYSVTNSTYTSWYSIFSGKYAVRTSVETFFPFDRLGQPDSLLPNVLKGLGYRTVYLTDCGATALFDHAHGFDEVYSVDRGFLACAKTNVISRHSLTGLLNKWFPEHQSACSTIYRREKFFQIVLETINRLDRSGPFLVAMHSCLTNHAFVSHIPRLGSSHTKNLPLKVRSSLALRLALSIREADSHLDRLLEGIQNLESSVFTFFFSDHGVRIDQRNGELVNFTHVMGDPVNRYQYNVPLAILPPKNHFLGRRQDLVALIDLYPTILKLSGYQAEDTDGFNLLTAPVPGRTVLQTSALPGPSLEHNGKIIELFKECTLGKEGFCYFSRPLDELVRSRRSLAIIQTPYRLVHKSDGELLLYNDVLDPYNLLNLREEKPQKATQLLQTMKSYLERYSIARASPAE